VSGTTLVSLLVGLAVVASLVLANDPAEILRLLAGASWGMLAVLALRLPQILFSALGWAPLILGPDRPGWALLFRMRWIRDAVNALLPVAQVGGEFVRAQLLIRRGIGTLPAAASVAVDLATEMAALAGFAAIGLFVLWWTPHGAVSVDWAAWAVALCTAMAGGFMVAQRCGLFRLAERLLGALPGGASASKAGGIAGLHEAVLRLYRAPRRLWWSVGAHLGSWVLGTLETWAALRILGVEAGLAEVLVIESLSQVVRSFGFLVPGAIGIQEGGFVLACGIFGISPDQALALALLRRFRDVTLGLPGIVAWRWEAANDARLGLAPAGIEGGNASP
jgi:putative membrane protein